jgi:hypothetical protein
MASVRTLKVGFSHRFCRRAPLFMVSPKQMEPSSRTICRTKNQQKRIKGKKVMAPQSKGALFYKKFSIEQLITYLGTHQKILKSYSVTFRVTTWLVELTMAILERFKSLNLNFKIRNVWADEVGGVKMKIRWFTIEKMYFLYCSFSAAPLALHLQDDL